jgi:poly(ADP-ribose) glycohydrolase
MSCVWQYFSTAASEPSTKQRTVTFTRRALNPAMVPDWSQEQGSLVEMAFSDQPIEDTPGSVMEVDFANQVVGGGILGQGSVQEEIMMALSPEMITARLFTEPLNDNEVLLMSGIRRYSRSSGYSDSFRFEGPHKDDGKERQIVAIDAKEYRDNTVQFKKNEIDREINKAFTAFYSPAKTGMKIATGHWGCGAFNGDKELKALIQLLAASKAQRELIFCLPGKTFKNDIKKTLLLLKSKQVSIGVLYKMLGEFEPAHGSLFRWLEQKLKEEPAGGGDSYSGGQCGYGGDGQASGGYGGSSVAMVATKAKVITGEAVRATKGLADRVVADTAMVVGKATATKVAATSQDTDPEGL